MKRVLGIVAAVVLAVGCGKNEIEIKNIAEGGVFFLFRGEEYFVEPGGTESIVDIPNGQFSYSTTYGVPSWASGSVTTGDLSGVLVFRQNQTQYTLLYSSSRADGKYSIGCNVSSTDPVP